MGSVHVTWQARQFTVLMQALWRGCPTQGRRKALGMGRGHVFVPSLLRYVTSGHFSEPFRSSKQQDSWEAWGRVLGGDANKARSVGFGGLCEKRVKGLRNMSTNKILLWWVKPILSLLMFHPHLGIPRRLGLVKMRCYHNSKYFINPFFKTFKILLLLLKDHTHP